MMNNADTPLYNVFVRNWWRSNPAWPNGLEPHAGKKTYLERGLTYEEARRVCAEHARTHKPSKLSRKAEFEQCAK